MYSTGAGSGMRRTYGQHDEGVRDDRARDLVEVDLRGQDAISELPRMVVWSGLHAT